MPEPVHVIGAARTDFKRNLRKEGRTIAYLIVEAGRAAIADAGIEPDALDAGVVGNFAAGQFTGQQHLGAFLTEIDPGLRGKPTLHVEAACASGSVAVLTAAQQIIGGLCEAVLVVGVEQQKTMPPLEGAEVLGAAEDYANEREQFGDFMFPKLFAHIAQRYAERHELTEEQLAMVAVKNYAHASLNPQAQMRDAELTLKAASAESEHNPRIAPPLKVSDCSQITDGAAAVVLCSERLWRRLGGKGGARLTGYGHTTDYLPLERKDIPEFTVTRKAVAQAFAMAGIEPRDLDGAEVHDCFSISEIVAYEIIGLAARGMGAELLASGATALPSVRDRFAGRHPAFSLPVNPGGGLMGDGHPVGATGVRQVAEAFVQLSGRAGERQIDGAGRYLTFNMGGSFTTNVAMVWESAV